MATGTRSGQFHNDGDNSKLKKQSIKGKTKDSSDTRSTGETPSYRRSERLVGQTPSSVEKRTSNPLRRSERIEKTGVSSSSGSKKSSTSSSSLANKKKKPEKSDKLKGAKEQSQENEVNMSHGLSKKRKRLDARSYRLFLRPQTRTTRSSAARELFKEDNRSQEDAVFSGSSVPEKGQVGGDDCGQVKEIEWEESDETCKDFIEGSSSVSRGRSGFINGDDGPRKKHKVDSVASKSKDSNNSPASKCSDSSSQSSPPAVTGKENGSDAVEKEINGKESGCDFDASRSGHPAANLDCYISVEVLDKEMSNREASGTHESSCSSGSKSKKTEGSTSCDKLQSQVLDSGKARVGESASSNAEEHLNSRETLVAIETDTGHNACVVCRKPGMLLCCDGKGCKRSYHLSCLDPPLKDIPLGAWLCLCCVIKKIELGVYSVSEGIESVLDIKEGEQHEKHYLVKYKGLAHVHNRWVSESQMVLEAPMLLAKYNKRRQNEKVARSKEEWTEPHRLLQKRLLMPLKMADDYISRHTNHNSYCYYEWLVKWRGLGYEHATWEFENSEFLTSAGAILLIKDYEKRHKEAKKLSDPSKVEEALQVKKNPFHRLMGFPEGFPPGLGNDQLNFINRLREFWHDSHNAICIDDQERIVKSILFLLALQSHTCRPFLVISTITSLPMWEAEITRLAPSVNVVVYTGNKDVRKIIRDVEFYEEGGCVMFQVLLSHPDVVVEDLEALNCIGWEAMLVDECQNPRVSKHFEKFKNLSTDFRLLLLCSQLKDNLAEYLNLLTLLDSGGRENCVHNTKLDPKDTLGALTIVKERLSRYLLYERKPDSKFLEYWVPVQISNVQLEQYCATLLSNSTVLHSCSKVDQVGALREILISTRQCCDHPYIVDPLLQSSLTKNLPASEYLDIGVNASGKLLLLDKFLQEIKSRELRVLILFQSIGGAGRNSIGDILDDFLRQRFGPDSYERVDSGLVNSKKLAALNMFNDRTRGRFVFLIENRACLPSIKLSSVDAVIIFDSDWNLLNDLRALQKISIESRFDQVKVFRLYSSFTLEEKVLVFAKQDTILDSNIQSITPSVSHSLLSWGASYLFRKLDEFHKQDKLSNCSETSVDKILLNDLVSELVSQLPGNVEGNHSSNCSLLVKARQSRPSYLGNTTLFGENERIASFDKDLPGSWSNLLKGRCPRWRYVSQLSQRVRRKVQNFDEIAKLPEAENDEGKKKRRKVATDSIDPTCQHTRIQDKTIEVPTAKVTMMTDNLPPHGSSQTYNIPLPRRNKSVSLNSIGKEHESFTDQANISDVVPHSADVAAVDTSDPHKSCMVDSEGMGKLDVSKRAHQKSSLKAELSKLCESLSLPGGVRSVAEMFLENVMKEHNFSQEPGSMLQAFTLSLCCRAASFLNHKVDKKVSLELARKQLNFVCNEEQVYSAYARLSILDRKFSCPKDASNDKNVQSSPESRSLISSNDVPTEAIVFQTPVPSPAAVSGHQLREVDKIKDVSNGTCSVGELTEGTHEAFLKTAVVHPNIESLKDVLLKKRIDLIERIYSRREEDIIEMQKNEMSDFNMRRKEEKRKLMKAYDSDLECCRSVYFDSTIRTNKIKRLNQEFSKKMAAFDDHMKFQRRKLALMQADARNKERQIKDRLLEEARSTKRLEFDDNLPLSSSGFIMESFVASEPDEAYDGSENNMFVSGASDIPGDAITSMVDTIPVVCRQDRACDGSGITVFIPVGNGSPPSGFNDVSEVELEGSAETPTGIQATVPTEMAHDVTVEAQSLATSHGVAGVTPIGRLGDKITESEFPPSECYNTREVTAVESSGSSLENVAINSDSETATINDIGKNSNADIPHGACLVTSLNEHAELPSLAIASVSNDFNCSIPSHQVPSNSERERLDVSSSEGNNHCFYSSQQTEIPESSPVNAVDSQVEQVHIEDDSDSLHLQFPPYTDVPLVEQSPDSAHRPITSKKEACQQRHGSSQQIEAVVQQQVADLPVHNKLSDQLVSHSTVQPLGPSTTTIEQINVEDLRNISYQTHNSAQPAEVLTQQPIVEKVLQSEQSNQLVNQSADAHQLPPAITEGGLCPEDHLVTSHRTSSSTQETVVFRQPAAASVQVGVPNQLVNQSIVQPSPPSRSAPTESRCSEDLDYNIQSESGNRRVQFFPMTNLIPSHLLHPDPLQNELVRIWNQKDACNKRHEDKKLQLKLEYDLEMEKVRKKYEILFQDVETECLDEKKLLDTIYKKVLMNCVLAEQFRAKFIENRGASASGKGSRSSYAQPPPQVSQPQVLQRPASAPTTSLLNPTTMFPTSTPAPQAPSPIIASARLHSQVTTPSSSQAARQTSAAVFSSNPVRHLSSVFPSGANLQVGIEPRAPAPHLHRFRALSAQRQPVQTGTLTSQQQPRASLASPSSMVPQVAAAPFPPIHSSMVSVGSEVLPGNFVSPINFPPDAWGSHTGADLPKQAPLTEVTIAAGRSLATDDEMLPGADASMRTSATVVCISDDECN